MYCYFFPMVQSHHYFTYLFTHFVNIIGVFEKKVMLKVCCLYQNLTFQ